MLRRDSLDDLLPELVGRILEKLDVRERYSINLALCIRLSLDERKYGMEFSTSNEISLIIYLLTCRQRILTCYASYT